MFRDIVEYPIVWWYGVMMRNGVWLLLGGYLAGLVMGFAACHYFLP
jgi:hypothetical protein